MKKSLGAIVMAGGAALLLLGQILPYGKVIIEGGEEYGMTDTDMSVGSLMFGGSFYAFGFIAVLVAIAAAVLGMLKKYIPAAILGIIAGLMGFLIIFANDGASLLDKELGGLGIFASLIKDYVSFKNGIGWYLIVLGSVVLLAGAILTFIGKTDSAPVAYGQSQDAYQNPNQF